MEALTPTKEYQVTLTQQDVAYLMELLMVTDEIFGGFDIAECNTEYLECSTKIDPMEVATRLMEHTQDEDGKWL